VFIGARPSVLHVTFWFALALFGQVCLLELGFSVRDLLSVFFVGRRELPGLSRFIAVSSMSHTRIVARRVSRTDGVARRCVSTASQSGAGHRLGR
jgi:hypothetical protein